MAYAADSLVAKIIGANPTIASLLTLGGQAANHVQNFRRYEPGHYEWGTSQGSRYWECSNFYDRAFIYYAWHAAETGDKADEYLMKGAELAINYRDTYVPPGTGGGVSSHWSQPCGVALHGIITNDATSKSWVLEVANNFTAPYYVDNLDDINGEMDNRMQARCLEAWLLAWLIDGNNEKWATVLRKGLTDILKTQAPDGGYPFQQVQNGGTKAYMVGLLNDAMQFYRRAFEDDARILPSIKKSCDFMWTNMWREDVGGPGVGGFQYTQNVPGETDPTCDLNNLIIGGYTVSGMADRVKQIFAGSFGTWLDGDKQFNQNYRESHRTCAQFVGAISAWTGGETGGGDGNGDIDPPGGAVADIEAAKAALVKAHNALDVAYAAIDEALVALG
jgi:hypothetical protein